MAIYDVKLIDRKEVAENTMAFFFEKPGGFTYKAGQFADFTLMAQDYRSFDQVPLWQSVNLNTPKIIIYFKLFH